MTPDQSQPMDPLPYSEPSEPAIGPAPAESELKRVLVGEGPVIIFIQYERGDTEHQVQAPPIQAAGAEIVPLFPDQVSSVRQPNLLEFDDPRLDEFSEMGEAA